MRFEKFVKVLLILTVVMASTVALAAENNDVACNALTDRQSTAPASTAKNQPQQQKQQGQDTQSGAAH
jgi:hypothetical protein